MEACIVIYDGVCNLCNYSVSFIKKRDKRNRFAFLSNQSVSGKSLMEKFDIKDIVQESFILLEGRNVYQKSTAALRVCRKLSGLWPLLYVFIILPRPLRDWAYDIVSRNRYRWFGKTESCAL
jgi:predicted DCC family thiol-disulfide oxidoreductase YuxK